MKSPAARGLFPRAVWIVLMWELLHINPATSAADYEIVGQTITVQLVGEQQTVHIKLPPQVLALPATYQLVLKSRSGRSYSGMHADVVGASVQVDELQPAQVGDAGNWTAQITFRPPPKRLSAAVDFSMPAEGGASQRARRICTLSFRADVLPPFEVRPATVELMDASPQPEFSLRIVPVSSGIRFRTGQIRAPSPHLRVVSATSASDGSVSLRLRFASQELNAARTLKLPLEVPFVFGNEGLPVLETVEFELIPHAGLQIFPSVIRLKQVGQQAEGNIVLRYQQAIMAAEEGGKVTLLLSRIQPNQERIEIARLVTKSQTIFDTELSLCPLQFPLEHFSAEGEVVLRAVYSHPGTAVEWVSCETPVYLR
jgi:hypothetical protein